MSHAEDFRAAIRGAGIEPPDVIEADGKLHRFPSNGKRGDDSGWYVLHLDGIPAGVFGDWRTGVYEAWRTKHLHKFTTEERREYGKKLRAMQEQRLADEERRHAEARKRAEAIWKASTPCGDHPYLQKKGVKVHRARFHDRALVLPLRDAAGVLHSLQFIDQDGSKKFLSGGRVSGCYSPIGKPCDPVVQPDPVLLICEGFATGASCHEATEYPTACAMFADNFLPVAKALRKKFPKARIIVCADDDYRTEGNPGITKATEAARAVGGVLAVPDFGSDRPESATDFNDLMQRRGAEAVKAAIEGGLLKNGPKASGGDAQRTRFRKVTESPETLAKRGNQPKISGRVSLANDETGETVHLQHGATVTPEAIRWLWRDHLARGKLHVIAGATGAGKTTLALAFAATITVGGRWPDGTRAAAGNVLVWSGEDDVEDTLAPRLMAMGANMDRVYFVGNVLADGKARPFDPARDMAALEREAERVGDMHLLIVDPVVQAVAGDSHKNTEVRRSLQPLVDLAQRLDAAALGISHFTKGSTGRDPVERVTGSVAFGALPRVVFAAAKTTDEAGNISRIFVRAKSNIGPDGGGFNFALEQITLDGHPGITATRVLWAGTIEGTARALLAAAEITEDPGERSATDEAVDWLRSVLEGGPMRASEAQKQARNAGISDKGLRRAREKLGIKPRKQDFAGGWEWALPSKMPSNPSHQKLGTLGALGTFEDALTTTNNTEDVEDALNTGVGGKGTLGGKCPKCAGEGCRWCQP